MLPAPDEIDDASLAELDSGERSAISLALSLKADVILIDDRKGAAAARHKGFEVTGTLGILDLAAEHQRRLPSSFIGKRNYSKSVL